MLNSSDLFLLQDGGLLTNNPAAIAIHESKLLWPTENIQCVISIGTGRYRPTDDPTTSYGLKDKLLKVIQSATDTEGNGLVCPLIDMSRRISSGLVEGAMGSELRRCSHHVLAHFASHRCGPSSIPGLGRGRMCEKFCQLLAVGRWFPAGTPVSSIRKLISS